MKSCTSLEFRVKLVFLCLGLVFFIFAKNVHRFLRALMALEAGSLLALVLLAEKCSRGFFREGMILTFLVVIVCLGSSGLRLVVVYSRRCSNFRSFKGLILV